MLNELEERRAIGAAMTAAYQLLGELADANYENGDWLYRILPHIPGGTPPKAKEIYVWFREDGTWQLLEGRRVHGRMSEDGPLGCSLSVIVEKQARRFKPEANNPERSFATIVAEPMAEAFKKAFQEKAAAGLIK